MGMVWNRIVDAVLWLILTAIFLVMSHYILGFSGLFLPADVAATLCLGWLPFLPSVGPHLHVDGSLIAIGTLCLVIFTGGLHVVLGRFFPSKIGVRWRWRWTGSVVSMIVMLALGALASVGAAHEAGRLMTSTEPWKDHRTALSEREIGHQTEGNLRQIALALYGYHDRHKAFPPGGTFGKFGRPLHSWMTTTLPYIDQPELYNQVNFQIPWDDPANALVFQKRLSIYENPGFGHHWERDHRGYALSHYAGNVHLLGGDRPFAIKDIKDGSSQTILIGEVPGNFKPWGDPVNWRDPALGINKSPDGFGGPFKGGTNFAFADGSVRFIKETIDPRVLKALGTPDGGEVVSADEF